MQDLFVYKMDAKGNKEKYREFCERVYVPIYSQPWWMDAICGAENWDVWIYEQEGTMMAAMPFYMENRNGYHYITKAPLTQNNGIIFNYPPHIKEGSKESFEEKIIDACCEFISSMKVDVYEQQYQTTFTNWTPFFWNGYTAIQRYTYKFDLPEILKKDYLWNNMDHKKRARIKKGNKNCEIHEGMECGKFYEQVGKIYEKQGLTTPFSYELWERLYQAVMEHGSGHIIYASGEDGTVYSCKFIVWDDRNMYALISGGDVKYQNLETKSALDWYAIQDAGKRGLNYDFEGSMIKRIAKAYREFGAVPHPYFRIRKVFNPEVLELEHLKQKEHLINDARQMGGMMLSQS